MSEDQDHGHSGGGVEAAFTHRVGPLPVGVWLLAVAGGLGIAIYARRKSAAAPAVAVTGGDYGTGNTDTQTGNGASVVGAGSGPVDNSPAYPTNNDDWYRRCMTVLTAKNYDPNLVDTALRKYLGGQALTPTEAAIKALALTYVGPPPVTPPPPAPGQTPDPTPTPKPIPTPTPKPPPPKPTPKPPPPPPQPAPPPQPRYPTYRLSHTNVHGDSYDSIARQYGTGLSGWDLYQYQFTNEAGRPEATKAKLLAYGTTIYAGGETEVPWPK